MAKSYWSPVASDGERHQRAILSWFGVLCEGMAVEKAEILCDMETDREKKIRAFVVDKDGKRRVAVRAKNKGGYTISLSAA